MSEVYWIAGYEFQSLEVGADCPLNVEDEADFYSSSLKKSGVQADWIRQFHRMSSCSVEETQKLAHKSAFFNWQASSGLDHYLLNSIIRAALTDDVDLAAVFQREAQQSGLVLIASPKAVGRYNLLPAARISECWETPLNSSDTALWKDHLRKRMKKIEQELENLDRISFQRMPASISDSFKKDNPRVIFSKDDESSDPNILIRLNNLVRQLEEDHLNFGLISTMVSNRSVLNTLVERI